MKPATAYTRLNNLVWAGRLPPATVQFIDNETIPRCYGLTLFDQDFARPVIFINSNHKHWGRTMVHECLHVAEPLLEHGALFDTLVSRYWKIARKNIRGLK